VLNEILGLDNKPTAAVHSVHKLTGPKKKKKKKEEEEEEKEKEKNRKTRNMLLIT